ncbi:MAG: ribosome maturation factor RimM [Chromatiales bacterium]|jgi:16S rRNA processing protein RimM
MGTENAGQDSAEDKINGERLIQLGHIAGVFGVKGWLKIYSETDPLENIVKYRPWYVEIDHRWTKLMPLQGKRHGKGVIAQLEGIADRDQAESLKGARIAVTRSQLPASQEGEFYWTDLEGLQVIGLDGFEMGVISHLFETGSNDVMVVTNGRERFIPFLWEQVVKQVDLENGIVTVDWDPDF